MAAQSKVLVIDDDEALRDYCRYILEKGGYDVEEAVDGDSGLQALQQESYDFIVTDIVMPGSEGIETIKGALLNAPRSRVIAMSGAANSEIYLSIARALGALMVLQKPFTGEELLAALAAAAAKSP